MADSLRIALIQSFLPSCSQGGVGHFTHQLAERLIARRHAVTVYSLDPAPAGAPYQVIRPSEHRGFYAGRLGKLLGFSLWLARQDLTRYDIVHAQGDNYWLRTSTPVIRTIHGAALAEARHARKLTTRLMFLMLYPLELIGAARATAAVGISQDTLAYFPWVKRIIYHGVERTSDSPLAPKSPVPAILFVGHRLHDRKRADLLLAAFAREVLPAIPTAELWLVCDDQVTQPQVKSYSNLSDDALTLLYQSAWVFCLPSSYEGFGRPYAEALACKTAVVATPNAGANEILEHGRYGVVVDKAQLGPTLVVLLKDPDKRAELAERGWQRAQMFTWERALAGYEDLYKQVLAQELHHAAG